MDEVNYVSGSSRLYLVLTTSVVAILILLSKLAHWSGFPVITALFVYAVVIAWLGIRANIANPVETSVAASIGTAELAKDADHKKLLQQEFAKWLVKRRQGAERYPVFVVAAEGGGIYAASAIGFFLSQLQDRYPQFAKHVFAVSAVSGGAVGATLFHSLLKSDQPSDGDTAASTQSMTSDVETILLADHLSPVVALVLPDLFGKFLPFDRAWTRASALEQSLICAHEGVSLCAKNNSSNPLMLPYDDHWGNGRGRPLC
jgi:hypothetical protein